MAQLTKKEKMVVVTFFVGIVTVSATKIWFLVAMSAIFIYTGIVLLNIELTEAENETTTN